MQETWVWSLGWEDSPREGNGYPLQYSGLENSWTEESSGWGHKVWRWLSDFLLSLSSFTFIKRLFSSSLLSAIKVVSSTYLRLLIFLPAILIPACASSSESERGEWKSWLKTQHSKNKDHDIQSYHFMANRWGKSRNSVRFSCIPKSMWMLTAATKLKDVCFLEGKLWQS